MSARQRVVRIRPHYADRAFVIGRNFVDGHKRHVVKRHGAVRSGFRVSETDGQSKVSARGAAEIDLVGLIAVARLLDAYAAVIEIFCKSDVKSRRARRLNGAHVGVNAQSVKLILFESDGLEQIVVSRGRTALFDISVTLAEIGIVLIRLSVVVRFECNGASVRFRPTADGGTGQSLERAV